MAQIARNASAARMAGLTASGNSMTNLMMKTGLSRDQLSQLDVPVASAQMDVSFYKMLHEEEVSRNNVVSLQSSRNTQTTACFSYNAMSLFLSLEAAL